MNKNFNVYSLRGFTSLYQLYASFFIEINDNYVKCVLRVPQICIDSDIKYIRIDCKADESKFLKKKGTYIYPNNKNYIPRNIYAFYLSKSCLITQTISDFNGVPANKKSEEFKNFMSEWDKNLKELHTKSMTYQPVVNENNIINLYKISKQIKDDRLQKGKEKLRETYKGVFDKITFKTQYDALVKFMTSSNKNDDIELAIGTNNSNTFINILDKSLNKSYQSFQTLKSIFSNTSFIDIVTRLKDENIVKPPTTKQLKSDDLLNENHDELINKTVNDLHYKITCDYNILNTAIDAVKNIPMMIIQSITHSMESSKLGIITVNELDSVITVINNVIISVTQLNTSYTRNDIVSSTLISIIKCLKEINDRINTIVKSKYAITPKIRNIKYDDNLTYDTFKSNVIDLCNGKFNALDKNTREISSTINFYLSISQHMVGYQNEIKKKINDAKDDIKNASECIDYYFTTENFNVNDNYYYVICLDFYEKLYSLYGTATATDIMDLYCLHDKNVTFSKINNVIRDTKINEIDDNELLYNKLKTKLQKMYTKALTNDNDDYFDLNYPVLLNEVKELIYTAIWIETCGYNGIKEIENDILWNGQYNILLYVHDPATNYYMSLPPSHTNKLDDDKIIICNKYEYDEWVKDVKIIKINAFTQNMKEKTTNSSIKNNHYF